MRVTVSVLLFLLVGVVGIGWSVFGETGSAKTQSTEPAIDTERVKEDAVFAAGNSMVYDAQLTGNWVIWVEEEYRDPKKADNREPRKWNLKVYNLKTKEKRTAFSGGDYFLREFSANGNRVAWVITSEQGQAQAFFGTVPPEIEGRLQSLCVLNLDDWRYDFIPVGGSRAYMGKVSMCGDLIAWSGNIALQPDDITDSPIHLYVTNISTGLTRRLSATDGSRNKYNIDLAEGTVIWTECKGSYDPPRENKLWACNVNKGQAFVVYDGLRSYCPPRTDGKTIVWATDERNKNGATLPANGVWAYDFQTKKKWKINDSFTGRMDIAPGLLVHTNRFFDGKSRLSVSATVMATGDEFRVTPELDYWWDGRLDGNRYLWPSSKEGTYYLHVCTLNAGSKATPAPVAAAVSEQKNQPAQ